MINGLKLTKGKYLGRAVFFVSYALFIVQTNVQGQTPETESGMGRLVDVGGNSEQ